MASEGVWETHDITIATGTTGDVTIFTPASGKRFEVGYIWIEETAGSADATYAWKSGSTLISGVHDLKMDTTREHTAGVSPVLVGAVVDEALVLAKTGSGVVQGWVVVRSML